MAIVLVAATRNQHKIREIRQMLRGSGIRVKSLADFPPLPEVIEDCDTLAGNAVKKALAVMQALNLPALSDDSGLFVTSLGNEPGVKSARYAGPKCDYAANNRKLLRRLQHYPAAQRRAYFATVMALAIPGKRTVTRIGKVWGRITATPSGIAGFGYDPVFIPAGFKSTFAQMTSTQKNSISHRARALQKIIPVINERLGR